jgi:outer membrane murein-binding lipoprotein Lpp
MHNKMIAYRLGLGAVVMLALLLGGCQSMYFSAMEKVGIHKRDILISRVEDAREAQQDTKEQFQSALDTFLAVTNYDGGELEETYRELKDVLDRSEARADELGERIDAVEDVAEALFDEWQEELGQYNNASLRRSSEQQLKTTRQRCDQLVKQMRRAEAKIEPVLIPLRDQVLYLKHNLNARAVAALGSELKRVRSDVATLVQELEAAVDEADRFIRTLEEQS